MVSICSVEVINSQVLKKMRWRYLYTIQYSSCVYLVDGQGQKHQAQAASCGHAQHPEQENDARGQTHQRAPHEHLEHHEVQHRLRVHGDVVLEGMKTTG